jgi:hypothetical protein
MNMIIQIWILDPDPGFEFRISSGLLLNLSSIKVYHAIRPFSTNAKRMPKNKPDWPRESEMRRMPAPTAVVTSANTTEDRDALSGGVCESLA